MNTEAVQEMLCRDRDEWEALVAALEAHPEGPLHHPESPEWTARDVFAHLARWIEHSTDTLEALVAGRPIPALVGGTDDEINARWQAEHSHMTIAEARARAQQAFERRVRAIEAVPPDRWNGIIEATARADGADHYRGHRSYIDVF